MERMTGIDPMFIYSDTPETPMEVAYACVLDPGSAEGGYSFERVRAMLSERIPGLPPLRRRLVEVPLGLDHPRWVEDPEFDLANHLFRAAVPAPGGLEEFAALAAAVMGRPLEPGQPPWEMHVVEGLADGRIGLIAKMHHSVVDGVAGTQLMVQLLDLSPEGGGSGDTLPFRLPSRLPSQVRLVTEALPNVLTSPLRLLRAAREVGRTAVRLARCMADDASGPVSIPLGAPRAFGTEVSPRRRVWFAQLDMEDVRAVKERFEVTVNDVVLAVCSGALRSHLAEHDMGSDDPLVAVVPVSVRAEEHAETLGNQLSAMFVPLANDRKTPLERLRTVASASASCKGQERAVGFGPAISLLTDAVPPALAKPAVQLGVRSGLVRRVRAGNLMISNVPGPDFALYFAGMRMEQAYPLGPVVDGITLNITVQTYRDALYVGINAGANAVPDLPGLGGALVDELTLLCRMTKGAGVPHHRRRAGSPTTRRATSAGSPA